MKSPIALFKFSKRGSISLNVTNNRKLRGQYYKARREPPINARGCVVRRPIAARRSATPVFSFSFQHKIFVFTRFMLEVDFRHMEHWMTPCSARKFVVSKDLSRKRTRPALYRQLASLGGSHSSFINFVMTASSFLSPKSPVCVCQLRNWPLMPDVIGSVVLQSNYGVTYH
jgi:hypothetical protein